MQINKTANKKSLVSIIMIIAFLLLAVDNFIYSQITYTIRIHDFAAILGMILFLNVYKNHNLNKYVKRNYKVIFIYLIYLSIINFLFFILKQNSFAYIFYIIKEFEYIIFFFLMFYMVFKMREFTFKILYSFIVLNIIYGIIQVASGKISYYGIGSITTAASAGSGTLYFLCFIISFYFYRIHNMKFSKLLSVGAFILTLATISKTNIIGLVSFIFIYCTINIFNNIRTKRLFVKKKNILLVSNFLIILIILIILFIIFSGYFGRSFENYYLDSLISRFTSLDRDSEVRYVKQVRYFRMFMINEPYSWLIGRGKGIVEYVTGFHGMAVDNQYSRALIEMGILGIIIWINLIRTLLKIVKNYDEKIFIFAFILSFLLMGLGFEVFQVTRAGIMFWMVFGMIAGNNAKEHYSNI